MICSTCHSLPFIFCQPLTGHLLATRRVFMEKQKTRSLLVHLVHAPSFYCFVFVVFLLLLSYGFYFVCIIFVIFYFLCCVCLFSIFILWPWITFFCIPLESRFPWLLSETIIYFIFINKTKHNVTGYLFPQIYTQLAGAVFDSDKEVMLVQWYNEIISFENWDLSTMNKICIKENK